MVIVIVQREVKCTIKKQLSKHLLYSVLWLPIPMCAKLQFVEKLFVIPINTPFATNLDVSIRGEIALSARSVAAALFLLLLPGSNKRNSRSEYLSILVNIMALHQNLNRGNHLAGNSVAQRFPLHFYPI